MLTVCEAMQRCQVNGVHIRRVRGTINDWSVTLREWSDYQCGMFAQIVDDLEDAVITGSKMRANAKKYG